MRAPALEASLPPRPPWLHCPYRYRASVARSVARVCATGCAVSSCVSRTRELPFLGRLSVRACRRRISSRVAAWSVPRRSSPPQRHVASGARLARTDYPPSSTWQRGRGHDSLLAPASSSTRYYPLRSSTPSSTLPDIETAISRPRRLPCTTPLRAP